MILVFDSVSQFDETMIRAAILFYECICVCNVYCYSCIH